LAGFKVTVQRQNFCQSKDLEPIIQLFINVKKKLPVQPEVQVNIPLHLKKARGFIVGFVKIEGAKICTVRKVRRNRGGEIVDVRNVLFCHRDFAVVARVDDILISPHRKLFSAVRGAEGIPHPFAGWVHVACRAFHSDPARESWECKKFGCAGEHDKRCDEQYGYFLHLFLIVVQRDLKMT
jgi:hypothetical protein